VYGRTGSGCLTTPVGAAGAATKAATPGVYPKLPTADTWVGGGGALADVQHQQGARP